MSSVTQTAHSSGRVGFDQSVRTNLNIVCWTTLMFLRSCCYAVITFM